MTRKRRSNTYKTVETITLMCFLLGVIMVCVTKFIPFVFLTLLAYPISFRILNRKVNKDLSNKNKEDKKHVN